MTLTDTYDVNKIEWYIGNVGCCCTAAFLPRKIKTHKNCKCVRGNEPKKNNIRKKKRRQV